MNDNKGTKEEFTVVSSLSDLGEDYAEFVAHEEIEGSGTGDSNETSSDPSNSNPEADPQAQAFYELLKEEGLIRVPDDYEFDGTFDGIKSAQEYTYQQQYELAQNQLLNSMPDQLRDIVQAGLSGVNDISRLVELKAGINTNIDLSQEANQKALLRDELSKTLSTDVLEEVIESYIDRGKLQEEAQKILERRNANVSAQIEQMRVQAEQERLAEQQRLQQFSAELNKEIQAQQWADTRKKKVMSEITGTYNGTPVIEAKLQNILSNPQHLMVLADFLTYYDGSQFKLADYKKLDSQGAEHIKNTWASKLSDKPNQIRNREQNRGNTRLTDFELFVE